MLISLTLNGQPRQVEADPRTLLLYLLREALGLRGTKYGCGEGECGACTIILNGRTVNACLITAGQAHGGDLITIEGLADEAYGAQVLDAFAAAGAVQCGFCTPGFVMSARALLADTRISSTEAIQRGLSGNLCRCTGYTKIIKAVASAAEQTAPIKTTIEPSNSPPAIQSDGRFVRPTSLDEALQLLAQPDANWRVVAGGTDLLVQHEHRLKALNLLDLRGLSELSGVAEDDERVRIGALTSYTDLIHSPIIQTWASSLAAAAGEVGGIQIQNMGTLGGNLVNASPAADSVPPLVSLEARLVLRSAGGDRTVPVQDFAIGPGQTVIKPNELLTEILIPKQRHPGQEITFFDKVGPRKAQTIAKASIAFRGWLFEGRLTEARLAFGAVAPTITRALYTESALTAGPLTEARLMEAGQAAHNECDPIDDIRSTAVYRRQLIRGLLIRNLWSYLQKKPA